MANELKKALSIVYRLVKATKREGKKQVKTLIKSGVLDKKQAMRVLRKIHDIAKSQRHHLRKLLASELKKNAKRAIPLARRAARRGRKVAIRVIRIRKGLRRRKGRR